HGPGDGVPLRWDNARGRGLFTPVAPWADPQSASPADEGPGASGDLRDRWGVMPRRPVEPTVT
ncbi:hypothetical protein, partial [Dietzia sp. SLG310A2-38A2]|uniref:hypothetical protein n=1 Tax=Dietzia sp. SLG310A2-38A2 TaxID=1630643 RepID=UPI0019D5C38D